MISFARYASLFQVPGLAHALRASVIGRLPIGMAMLAILLFIQGRSGSFAQAGAASSLYVFGLAALAPFVGRVIDRLGPRPVLLANAIVYPSALLLLMLLVERGAHPLWVAACSFLAGASLPPITICMRTLFPRLIHDPGLLQTAYSIDSALIEIVFILGPTLVALFIAVGQPGAAVVAAAVCAALGTAWFVRAPAIRDWTPTPAGLRRSLLGPLRQPRLLKLLAVTLLYSLAFGLFEVAVPAFAALQGKPAAAGVILALASGGSAIGALVYGSRDWPMSLPHQFLLALAMMAAGLIVLSAVSNVYLFAMLSVAGCAPMAPVIAVQSLLVSRLAPRATLAESFTWATTALLGGISAGIAAGGVLVELWSPSLVIAAAGAATAIAGVLSWATLSGGIKDEG